MEVERKKEKKKGTKGNFSNSRRKEKERKRATKTRFSFIDGCRGVSLSPVAVYLFLPSPMAGRPLEEAEEADNYFHAAAVFAYVDRKSWRASRDLPQCLKYQ